MCTDRYRFMLGFAAAMQRRQVSLLPASVAPAVLQDLVADYPDVYALTDDLSARRVHCRRFGMHGISGTKAEAGR